MKNFYFETMKTPEQELEQVRKQVEALEKIASIVREAKLLEDYLPPLFLLDVEEGLRLAREKERKLENEQN